MAIAITNSYNSMRIAMRIPHRRHPRDYFYSRLLFRALLILNVRGRRRRSLTSMATIIENQLL